MRGVQSSDIHAQSSPPRGLKHNLNARALASLDGTNRELQTDIRQLIAEMDGSIREADAFIRTLQLPAPGPTGPASSGAGRQPPTRP